MPQDKDTQSSPNQDIDFSQVQDQTHPGAGDIDFSQVQDGGMPPPQPSMPMGTIYGWEGAKNIGAGLKESGIQTLHGAATIARQAIAPQMREQLIPQAYLDRLQQEAAPQNIRQGGVKYLGQALQYLPLEAIPGAPLASAGALGRIVGGGALSAMQADEPSAGEFAKGALLGAGGEAVSGVMRRLAPAMAETAAGIGAQQRGFGRTTGQTLLEQTTALSPAKLEGQVNDRITSLRNQRIAGLTAATNRNAFGSTTQAHQIVNDAMNRIPFNASPEYRNEMSQLRDAITNPNNPQQRLFSPSDLEQLRQGIDTWINRWGPAMQSDPGAQETLHALYNEINRQIDMTTPGDAKLRQNITSLVPASRRYAMIQRNAGITQNVAKRISAPTGALTAAMTGGVHGGPLGMAAGLVIPELISTPSTRMAFARGARLIDLTRIPKVAAAIAQPATQ